MSRFHGPQPGYKIERPYGTNGPKGALRKMREQKRVEAEVRNELTPPERRASFRRQAQAEETQTKRTRKRRKKGGQHDNNSGSDSERGTD